MCRMAGQALWRSGSLAGALALLDEVPCSWPPSQKCQQLQQHLRRLTPKLTEAEAMHEDGSPCREHIIAWTCRHFCSDNRTTTSCTLQ